MKPHHLQYTVFLDESNKVKLGDFGLSKALAQASFANTYVGVCLLNQTWFNHFSHFCTRLRITCLQNSCRRRLTIPNLISGPLGASFTSYVRSNPHFMKQKRIQNSVYVFGKIVMPFNLRQADVRFSNGRIPPLPRGYSQGLSTLIKAMLNLNVRSLIYFGAS